MSDIRLRILDYEQVETELERITKLPGFERQQSFKTTCDKIEVPYYTYGKGNNHIIVCGGTHGSEIISVDFVLRMMENIAQKRDEFESFNTDDYTFHFIPVHNVEGYIVSTSAIRTIIDRDETEEIIEQKSKKYFLAYRQDDIESKNDDTKLKYHQKMFSYATYECIPDKYPKLKTMIKEIYGDNRVPPGSMVIHRGNGLGQETNRSSLYAVLDKGETKRGIKRYNNIDVTIPGPLGIAPKKGEKMIRENEFLQSLIKELYDSGKYCGMITYHGTGGMIFARLSKDDEQLEGYLDEYCEQYKENKSTFEIINEILAEKYVEATTYTLDNGDKKKGYQIVDNPSLKDFDEYLRINYPAVLLIELSYMGGNPIGPLGDKQNNYIPTIKSNMKGSREFFESCKRMKRVMYSNLIKTNSEKTK